MFGRIMNTSLKPFLSAVERRVKTENPVSIFTVEKDVTTKNVNNFMKLLIGSKQINCKKIAFFILGTFFGHLYQ